MNQISVIIITFNEEKNIEQCLQSVVKIADEIIVVDSFSTDQTEQICNKFSVKFIQHHFEGYSAQKNFANSFAKFPYVFSIDGDEVVSPELENEIMQFKEIKEPSEGYLIPRLNNYCGKWLKHGGWYPDKKLRLWQKSVGEWFGEIHENVQLFHGAEILEFKHNLFHYTYSSIHQHILQANKFTMLSAEEMFNAGKRSNYIKIFFSPLGNFIKGFFIKFGFLDGYYGVIVCLINAFATFLKYIKLKELNRNDKKRN